MRTRFDEKNKQFTDDAHEAAKEQVYPHLFKNNGADIDVRSIAADADVEAKFLDLQYGIDVVVEIEVAELDATVPVYIQERFRAPEYRHYQDLTITKHNNASGEPSELSKIAAQQFIYGYYQPVLDEIQEAVCVNVPALLRRIADGSLLCGEERNEKDQDFVTVPFELLRKKGVIAFHLDRTESKHRPVILDRRENITAYSRGGGE
jgi:hypothetical protein